ncbi:MAG: ABC transporter ATP-binding protein, partial [Sedimentibacter sp.]
MSNNVIEIKNLSKYYGKHRGIEDVSFTVEEGEIYGFIGPNGAGKSTTIRTLLALIHPTSGNATIFGMDCIKEAHKIAKSVGYLPSEAYYYENMKVRELLKYSSDLYQIDCSERINELKERLKLDDTRKISDLSFGNKKKVGVVAALLHSPKLIILDEPTNGLDPLIKETFFEILKEENIKGATILYSSHVLSEVQKACSKVAI